MEPRSYTAEYHARRNAITLYTSSNIPGIVRDAISESLGLPGSRLRVVAPDVGGSFGSKGSLYPEELLICIAARKLGRSLKWTADRLEDISSSSQAFAEIVDAEMGFDENGVAVALQADVLGDVGAYSIYPWTCGLEPVQVVSFLPGPYKIRSYRGAVRGVATCKPPTGPYRGVGRPISTFVTERLDGSWREGARSRSPGDPPPQSGSRGGISRIGSHPGSSGTRPASSNASMRPASRRYEQLRVRQAEARKEGRLFGIGIASYAELTGIGSRIAVAPGMPINTGSETAKISHRFDRRHHGGLRGRLSRPGVRDHAGADHRRRSRRDTSRISVSSRATATRCRCRPAPMRAAARCSAAAPPSTHRRCCGTRSSASPRICLRPATTTSRYPAGRRWSLARTAPSRSSRSRRRSIPT